MNLKENWPILAGLAGLGLAVIYIARKNNPEPRGINTPCRIIYDKVIKQLKFICFFHNPEKVFNALKNDVLKR